MRAQRRASTGTSWAWPIAREFPGGTVFFLGGGFLELSGSSGGPAGTAVALWLQVRDLATAHRELAAHVVREPRREPWGLREMWLTDPDGTRIVLVEVPPGAPAAPRPPPLTRPPHQPPYRTSEP